MFCKSCGSEIPTGVSECPKCGKPVEVIMAVDEEKPQTVASSAPITVGAVSEKKKAQSESLVLPAVELIISAAGLVYLYLSNTLSSILSWFTSNGEQKHLRPEINVGTDPAELLANIGVIALTVVFVIIGIIGLVVLFRRLGRKFNLSKKS